MVTKAELEAELAQLKSELKRRDEPAVPDKPAKPTEVADLRGLMDEHGLNTDTLDALRENLLEELGALQKDKPLVVLAAALALGFIIGRSFR
ncbi:MAG: hypothetical protein COC12_08720 [Rhodobacteraceae bacterium]|nr:MAG: hypothetical protein COC12_08720 [Paracoccaceae bacterium]